MSRALTRTWYRVAVARPGGVPAVVAAAGEHMGFAVAAAERHAAGSFAIAAEIADESEIPLGESLGKSQVVELGAAPEVPVFHWPVGVLPKLSAAAAAGGARRGWIARPDPALHVIEAQTTGAHLTDLFLGLIERLPSADNLEVRVLDHFEDAGRADVWLTSRVDARRILRLLDDHDEELLGNGHLELSVYVRAQRATLRLTEHRTVVWLASDGALDGDVRRWLRELEVPEVDALVTVKDAPHFHYRPARSRDRKRLGDELYRERLRRVDTLRPTAGAARAPRER
ncbi:MAG TPA: hypothetical protein VHW23_36015 [Kofleriaceae bacterium]|jgi:hypothetical protein|nr:hypothetical protein [Kofleriaceae bacterium]